MGQTEPYSLSDLYEHRFSAAERERKTALWKVLCQSFFQKYVRESDTVVDLGAGYEFRVLLDGKRPPRPANPPAQLLFDQLQR